MAGLTLNVCPDLVAGKSNDAARRLKERMAIVDDSQVIIFGGPIEGGLLNLC
jgi:hypothetical protein